MSNYKLNIQGIESPLIPNGLNGLKLVLEKKNGESFFRQKITGSLDFVSKDFKKILPLESECCKELNATILQECSNSNVEIYNGKFKTNELEWDFDLCSAKLPQITQRDFYTGVYKYWEKKINMCSVPKTQTVKYVNRVAITEETSNYPTVENNRGCYFSEWVYFCIKKTFEGTEYQSIIPTDNNSMSYFLFNPFNTCTGKRNSLAFGIIYQASDFMFSQSQPATGLLQNGLISEDLALTLKDLFECLKTTFDLDWCIENGKIKIEHISYFQNNLSYERNNQAFSLDLSNEKYSKFLKDYSYSYKNDTTDFYGIEELKLTLNESTFKSKNSYPNPIEGNNGTEIFQLGYQYGRFSDFEIGNIKFDANCVPYDEKGEVKKKLRNSSLFLTAFEPCRLADESVDKTKFVLLDCKKIGNSTTLNEVIIGTCERVVKRLPNGNFSATAIMRDFLRYEKPFSVGLMNYAEKPNGLIGNGFNREMFSIIKTKKLKRISIPICCNDNQINPNLKVKLPNLTLASFEKLEFQLSDSMLHFDLMQSSNCGYEVKFPDVQDEEKCKKQGEFLESEQVYIDMSYYNYSSGNWDVISIPTTRSYYADGECGIYFVDIPN